jgi:ribosomal protein L40E
MTTVTDYKLCRQCGYELADYELDCSTSEESVDCRKCGHSAALQRMQEADGKVNWISMSRRSTEAFGAYVAPISG